MRLYCQSCGTPHEYSIRKPNFCQNCALPFGGVAAATAKVEKVKVTKIAMEDDYDDEDEEDKETDSVPDLKELKVDVEFSPQRGVRLGDVAGTSSGPTTRESDGMTNDVPHGDFMKEFQREAGSLRSSNKRRKNNS